MPFGQQQQPFGQQSAQMPFGQQQQPFGYGAQFQPQFQPQSGSLTQQPQPFATGW
jgi:hypothetical protein